MRDEQVCSYRSCTIFKDCRGEKRLSNIEYELKSKGLHGRTVAKAPLKENTPVDHDNMEKAQKLNGEKGLQPHLVLLPQTATTKVTTRAKTTVELPN